MCKHMTAVSRMCILITWMDIVNQYNNIYQRTIKIKSIEVKDNTYSDYIKEVNDKDPKLKVSDHVRTSKYKSIFAKGYTPKWSEEVFVIKEVKNTVPWTVIMMKKMMMKKLLEHYMKKNYRK